jgi:hypothetical protein
MAPRKHRRLPIIGWREWVALPELNVDAIKVKVDTGARSSSLHAFEVREFKRDGETWVRFKVHPDQRKSKRTVAAEARVIDKRIVRSSSGKAAMRPVIATPIEILGTTLVAEVTLANRDEMGFRMLLGREAFRKYFLVDAGGSYYGGKPVTEARPRPNPKLT